MAKAVAVNEKETTASSGSSEQYTRLHITPLDPSLLSVVVPTSVLPRARNLSYHTVETYPEKRYGFVDLPSAEAEKLKKKLHGAVLRGAKMRVEKAKPESIPEPTGEAVVDAGRSKKERKSSRKRKRELDVIDGVELQDRKVKRGWTTSEQEMIDEKRKKREKKGTKSKEAKEDKRDKKSEKTEDAKKDKKDKKVKGKAKSKYTDGPECLFKTKVPDKTTPEEVKEKDSTNKRKEKRKGDRKVVIHEFEKSIKHPSFLKSTSEKFKPESLTYEDDVGWIDGNGNVVEPISTRRKSSRIAHTTASSSKLPDPVPTEEDDETSSSGSSSDEDEPPAPDPEVANAEKVVETAPSKKLTVETKIVATPSLAVKQESARPKSSGSATSLTIKIPPATPVSSKVHPLEALYKRPKGDERAGPSQETKPFSFFDNNDDVEEEADDATAAPSRVPMTPFTRADFDFRNVRSAAPTPDTAHPSRSFSFFPTQESLTEGPEGEEEEQEAREDVNGLGKQQDGADQEGKEQANDDDDDDDDVAMVDDLSRSADAKEQEHAISDFQKQFWEKRGDLNRSWRRRRKTAAKEKRYRENRARAHRAL